jgi:hypothetical protein
MPSGRTRGWGQACLKLPVPQRDALRKLADLLNALAGK